MFIHKSCVKNKFGYLFNFKIIAVTYGSTQYNFVILNIYILYLRKKKYNYFYLGLNLNPCQLMYILQSKNKYLKFVID